MMARLDSKGREKAVPPPSTSHTGTQAKMHSHWSCHRQPCCPHIWAKALASPCCSPAFTFRCANLLSPSLLSSPSKPQSRYVFARKGTETLQATKADFCFVWFLLLCAQGCWKIKLDIKSPKLFEEEKGLSACQAGFRGAGGGEPAKKLLLSILKNGIIKWNRQDMYIMHK